MAVIDEEAKQQAKELWLQGKKYREISEITGIKESSIKSLASRIWKKEKLQPKKKKVATKVAVADKDKGPPKAELLPEEIEMLENEKLTEEQRFFCLYYVKYRNKVRAYQKAFNCSYINACGNASNLFKNIEIQKTITELLNDMRNEIKLEAKDIILKKMQIAFADITDYVSFGMRKDEETGREYSYVEFKESDSVDGSIIHEVKRGKDGVSIKLYDSDKALDWLYDHLVITEEQRARINILKSKVPDTNATNFNEQIHSIADLINTPVPERSLNGDTVCTSDDKAE
ncbi:terminase small subunit [[Clostridium] innocuum]|nr:terminase small subunit [[Clostridium] innocuum]